MAYVRTTQSKKFEKEYRKLPENIKERFHDRLYLFMSNPSHPLLKQHALYGEYQDCLSINITGDYRAIFQYVSDNTVEFVRIGTHAQLYDK